MSTNGSNIESLLESINSTTKEQVEKEIKEQESRLSGLYAILNVIEGFENPTKRRRRKAETAKPKATKTKDGAA